MQGAHGEPQTIVAMFLLGLTGGLSHCTMMCGGFAIAFARIQQARHLSHLPAWLLFNAGRIGTYTLLTLLLVTIGAGSGMLGGPTARSIWAILLGVFLLSQAWQIVRPSANSAVAFWAPIGARIKKIFELFWQKGLMGMFVAGLAWGWLPCGMSLAAITASASHDLLPGLIRIVAFGIGTVIPLSVLSQSGRVAMQRWRPVTRWIAAVILFAYAAQMIFRASHKLMA